MFIAKGSIREQLVRGTLGVGVLTGLSLPLSLITSIILARGLGPEGFGRYAFVMACVTLLSLPVGPGVLQLVTREVSIYHGKEQWGLFRGFIHWTKRRGLLISLVLLGAIGCFALLFMRWHGEDSGRLLTIGALIIPLLCLQNVQVGELRGLGRAVYAKIPDLLIRPVSHLAVCSGLLWFGFFNPGMALASQVMAVVLALAGSDFLLRRNRPGAVADAALEYRTREWTLAWRTFILLVGASMLNSQIGIVLLGWLGTDQDVASLRLASKGAQFVVFSLMVINMVIAPHVTQAHGSGNRQRLQRLSRHSARLAFAGGLPVALLLIFWGAPIIGLLFGHEYVGNTTRPLAILAGGQLVNTAFGSVGLFLTMTGHEIDTFKGQAWALLINLILALLLIPRMGVDGAAYAAAVGLVAWNLVLAVKLVKRLNIRPTAF